MKRKVLLTLVTLLLCTILMACGKNTPETSVDEENSSEETIDSNEETQIFEGYQEISLDKIGEYEYEHISYSDFKDNYVLSLGRVNLQSDISDNTYTLNLDGSNNLNVVKIDYDYIKFKNGLSASFDDLDIENYSFYTPVDTGYIEVGIHNKADELVLNKYTNEDKTQEFMNLQVRYGEDVWELSNTLYEEERATMQEFCDFINCIEPTYDESAPLIMKKLEDSLKQFSFNNIKFDFTDKQIGSLKEIEFTGDGKISKLPVLSFRNPDSTEWIDFILGWTLYHGVESDIEEIKKETVKLFEIPFKNYNLRVYEFEDDGKSVVGFIKKGENTEYILMIDTNMSIEELEQFFRDVVIDE